MSRGCVHSHESFFESPSTSESEQLRLLDVLRERHEVVFKRLVVDPGRYQLDVAPKLDGRE
jgi:hypothetical protein